MDWTEITKIIKEYGLFAVLFIIMLYLLWHKYESDIKRYRDDIQIYRQREEKIDGEILETQKKISDNLSIIAVSQEKIVQTQESILTCMNKMNTEFLIFAEVQKHKDKKTK